MLDPLDCYELCVQSPRHIVPFLRALHGAEPTVLREDFCGSAAVSRRWVADGLRAGEHWSAVAVDLDGGALDRARGEAGRALGAHATRVTLTCADAVWSADRLPTDVVFVGNFSIGYIHRREELVRYLAASRERLLAGGGGFGGGVFVCDTYGGASAFRLGGFTRRHPGRGREMIEYAWRHERADPATCMVENSISFRVLVDGDVVAEYPGAFTYRWRLWGIAEIRDAMAEAGFERSGVYTDVPLAPGELPEPAESLPEDWIVLVAGWAGGR